MANYKEIHGVKVQYRDSDATAVEGDVWYNSITSKLKMYVSLGSWASGGNVNTNLQNLGGCGIQTAAIKFGGYDPGGNKTVNESYDGSSWTEVADLNTGRRIMGSAGLQGAALAIGGFVSGEVAVVESWDNSSWTEVAD